MGTIRATTYANIFMGKFEKVRIYSYVRNISKFCCKFIDKIFFLWYKLNWYVIFFNKRYPTIKFEFTYSKTSITFLNTKIYKNQNWIRCTTIYRKPNDCRNIFHFDLAHPKSLKDNIPFSQPLPIKRICSETSKVIRHFKDLKDAFIKRSYKPELLDYHFKRAIVQIENHFYKPRKSQKNLPLVVNFNISCYQVLKVLLINTDIFFLLMKN